MSLLPSGTYASPNNPYYGAGGGGNLTSPVNITGNPEAVLNLTSATTQSVVQFGSQSNIWSIFTDVGYNALQLTATPPAVPNATYIRLQTDLSGTVTLGPGTPGATVISANSLLVTDPLGGPSPQNGIVVSPQSATVNKISGTVATGGSLRLGSSVATPAVVQISDSGANSGTFQVGGNGGDPLQITGGQVSPNNYSVIRPNVGSGGQLYIGSSTTTNPAAINITDTALNVSKLGGAPGTLLAAQTVANGASVNVPLPAAEGLYSIVGCGVGGTATAYTRQGQFSCMAYINSAGVCQMGGSAAVDTGALGGSDSVLLQVNPTGTALTLYNNGAQSLVSFQVSAFRISGPIPGVV